LTSAQIFAELRVALKAGHYRELSHLEKNIYKNAFRNGYKLAKKHNKKNIYYIKANKPHKGMIDSLINKVCIRLEVHKDQVLGKCRKGYLVRARSLIHNILREKYYMSLPMIGHYFNQDHTTVLNSVQMKQDKRRFWRENETIWKDFETLLND
jgi:chromosomal replication initiation ATPase DnaA